MFWWYVCGIFEIYYQILISQLIVYVKNQSFKPESVLQCNFIYRGNSIQWWVLLLTTYVSSSPYFRNLLKYEICCECTCSLINWSFRNSMRVCFPSCQTWPLLGYRVVVLWTFHWFFGVQSLSESYVLLLVCDSVYNHDVEDEWNPVSIL
jgi:hypothetical protein